MPAASQKLRDLQATIDLAIHELSQSADEGDLSIVKSLHEARNVIVPVERERFMAEIEAMADEPFNVDLV